MSLDKAKVQELIQEFTVSQKDLEQTAVNFQKDIEVGLVDISKSTMRLLKSYVGLPTGEEKGDFLALDFGGTNVRALRIRLLGAGKFEVLSKVAKPLYVPGQYDFIGPDAAATDLFDFIAGIIDEALAGDHTTPYKLGHTFSFPSSQTNLNNARLIIWTKEFATKGVEGEVVNDLLLEALQRRGVGNVEPVAVINDTVAVLLAAAYKQPDTYVGSIYATGHNTCYLEPHVAGEDKPMILNMECGGFSRLQTNRLDDLLDKDSEKPGEQRLEKMVSGRYMGVLFGMALGEAFGDKTGYGFTSIDMSNIVLDQSVDKSQVCAIVKAKAGQDIDVEEAEYVQKLVAAIIRRSAELVTSTYVGIVRHLAENGKIKKQHVAVDGSVYEKMPLVQDEMKKTLKALLPDDYEKVDTMLENGGSGLGAAIAAAMAE